MKMKDCYYKEMKKIIIGNVIIAISIILSCNTTEPTLAEKTITLTLEDAASIEAWIKLTTTNLQLPTTVTLKRNNTVSQDIILSSADTVIYIDSLQPNTTYSFQACGHSGLSGISSNQLQVTTMDTTSHNFTFETWNFGEHSSSVLRDVAIINENNIWAVGEIYMNDSLGQPDPRPYGAIHWDGVTWTPIKVPYHDFGSTNKFPRPLKTILAFDEDNIYVTSSANLLKLEGDEWIEKAFFMKSIPFDGQVLKMWGTDSNNIYCVGRNGAIYRYNGTLWWKMSSGTELDIYDIWGDNTENENYEILCIASNSDIFIDNSKVLKIEGTSVKEMNNEGLPIFISTIWFIPERKYFIAGDGLYRAKYLWEKWVRDYTMPPYYKTGIRANGFNDIVMVGAFGLLMHYNGFSWKSYNYLPYFSGSYVEVKIKGDILACTGGLNDGQAIITIGRR